MSEAHWVGNPPEYKGGPWCLTCDEERTEILECEYCGKHCCATCSEESIMGIMCIMCIEEREEE